MKARPDYAPEARPAKLAATHYATEVRKSNQF
jgi:hypothetical protein